MSKQLSRPLLIFLCLAAVLILVNVAELFYTLASEDYASLAPDHQAMFEEVRTFLLLEFWSRTIGLIGISIYAYHYWPRGRFSGFAKLIFFVILGSGLLKGMYNLGAPMVFRVLNIVLTVGMLYYQANALEEM